MVLALVSSLGKAPWRRYPNLSEKVNSIVQWQSDAPCLTLIRCCSKSFAHDAPFGSKTLTLRVATHITRCRICDASKYVGCGGVASSSSSSSLRVRWPSSLSPQRTSYSQPFTRRQSPLATVVKYLMRAGVRTAFSLGTCVSQGYSSTRSLRLQRAASWIIPCRCWRRRYCCRNAEYSKRLSSTRSMSHDARFAPKHWQETKRTKNSFKRNWNAKKMEQVPLCNNHKSKKRTIHGRE